MGAARPLFTSWCQTSPSQPMPNGKKICELPRRLKKAPLYAAREMSFPVKIESIDCLRFLIHVHEDTTTSFLRRWMLLCACSLILTMACGCKQAPWETLTPRYSGRDLPHLYSASTVLEP